MHSSSMLRIPVAVLLAGCTAFTPPLKRPVIEDRVGEHVGTLATKAERRIAYVDLHAARFCAEPSPDVSEAFSNVLKLAVEGAAEKSGAQANASIDFQSAFSNAISPLMVRSQGVQFFRDGTFALCQMHFNRGNANATSVDVDLFETLMQHASTLIQAELASIAQARLQLAKANAGPGMNFGGNSTVTIHGAVNAPVAGAEGTGKTPAQHAKPKKQ